MSFDESVVEDHAITRFAAIGICDQNGAATDEADERVTRWMRAR